MGERSAVGPSGVVRDEALMLAAGRGDSGAFAALVARHRERAVHFCHRLLLDRYAAEDVAQEGFVRLYLMRERYRPRARFTTLLYEILKNLCLDELSRRRRWAVTGGPSGAEPREAAGGAGSRGGAEAVGGAAAEPATEEVLRRELLQAVHACLGRLPTDFRAALVLREFEELSYEEVSKVMGWTSSKTRVTIHRARQRLASELRKEGQAVDEDGA